MLPCLCGATCSQPLAQLVERLLQTALTLGKREQLVLYQRLLGSYVRAQPRCSPTAGLGDVADVLPFLLCLHRVSLLILPHGLLPHDYPCDHTWMDYSAGALLRFFHCSWTLWYMRSVSWNICRTRSCRRRSASLRRRHVSASCLRRFGICACCSARCIGHLLMDKAIPACTGMERGRGGRSVGLLHTGHQR